MNRSSLRLDEEEHVSLCEALDRVLTKGVVVHGDLVISVADVDLVYLGIRLLLTSTETAIRAGALLAGSSWLGDGSSSYEERKMCYGEL